MFTLAYLSDPHIAPIPKPRLRQLMGKRIFGYINWRASRKNIHDRRVLDTITQDMLARDVDHIAVGGDLVNLSLPEEFVRAADWLGALGGPDDVSVIPGNHDAYVPMKHAAGIGQWADYMATNLKGAPGALPQAGEFPFVRQFGKIALIGLSSAVPKPPFFASGKLGAQQIGRLEALLQHLERQNMFRIVMVHHPPVLGLSSPRRALDDVKELQEVLLGRGAELVLYGHRHFHAVDTLPGESETPIVGASSASSSLPQPSYLARYYLFRIWQTRGVWQCEMTVRGLRTAESPVSELEKTMLKG